MQTFKKNLEPSKLCLEEAKIHKRTPHKTIRQNLFAKLEYIKTSSSFEDILWWMWQLWSDRENICRAKKGEKCATRKIKILPMCDKAKGEREWGENVIRSRESDQSSPTQRGAQLAQHCAASQTNSRHVLEIKNIRKEGT